MSDSATDEWVYERLARKLEGQIVTGTLLAGDRLPSIRQLCQTERVSPGSATQAFSRLEAKGLIVAKPRSGYYVKARHGAKLPIPETSRTVLEPTQVGVSDEGARVFQDASRREIFSFGAAFPKEELFPTDKLARCLAAASRDSRPQLGKYEIAPGQDLFCRILAKRLSTIGCSIPSEELTITVGAMEALNLAIRAVARPGDIVAVPSPCYFGVLEILESLGIKALSIPSTCDHGVAPGMLKEALNRYPVKALVLVTAFNNPDGSCLNRERAEALMNVLRDADVPLIEDDVYGDLYFGASRPLPVKALDPAGDHVIYCGSFSKSVAPGFRVGWIAAGRYTERVRRLKYISTLSTPAILQVALAYFMDSGAMDRHLRKLRPILEGQVKRMSDALLTLLPPGTAVSQPQGGFFLWIELPHMIDSQQLYDQCIERKVGIVPGHIFCPHGSYANFFRLSCGMPWNDEVARGIEIIGQCARELLLSKEQ